VDTVSENHAPFSPRSLLVFAQDAHAQFTLPLLEKVRPGLRTSTRANVVPITKGGVKGTRTGDAHTIIHSYLDPTGLAEFVCWECSRNFY
jgi:hypothetical protein